MSVTPSGTSPVVHQTIGVWAAWALVAVIILFFIPPQYRYIVMGLMLLGGLYFLYQNDQQFFTSLNQQTKG